MQVLIVDDSKLIRMLVAECITDLGHEIIHMENGVDAVEYIKSHSPDLIMMDVEMPGLNGFETTRQIRVIKGDDWFPIIFLSAKVDEASYEEGILAGGDAYLEKPIEPWRLQLQIKAMERIYVMRQKLKTAQEELMLINEKYRKLSLFDELTGLANRRNFDQTLGREFKLAKRDKNPLSVVLCDIDFFKIYNDTYGHQAGDDCLAKVAEALGKSSNRPTDLACRYGGEEFTFILPNTDLSGAQKFSEKVRLAVSDLEIMHEGSKVLPFVSLSLGVATYNGQFSSGEGITKQADALCIKQKKMVETGLKLASD